LVETVAMNFYAAEFPSATTLAREGKRATKLLRDLHAGDAGSAARFRYNHPRFAWMTDEAIRETARMPDARFVAAREYGFSSWARLREHLEGLGGKREVRHPFETGLQYYRDRAAGMLSVFDTGERNAVRLVRLFHPDYAAAPEPDIRAALLLLALSFGRTAMVHDLLDAGADPDLPNNKGWTALHQAAYADPAADPAAALAMLDALLKAGASPFAQAYGDGGTPLAVALFWGHRVLAERLATPVVAPSSLRVAAGLGRLDLMEQFFVGKQLRPEARWHREFHRPHSGFPPWRPNDDAGEILGEALTYAARSGRIEAMAVLAERGADLDAEPYNGTALHWAVARKKAEAAAWLIDHGADINRRAGFGGTRGVTPLHIAAAWGGSPDCARLLVERGADVTVKAPEHNGTPADWARHFNNPEIAAMISKA
jgi:hypothetical protein